MTFSVQAQFRVEISQGQRAENPLEYVHLPTPEEPNTELQLTRG